MVVHYIHHITWCDFWLKAFRFSETKDVIRGFIYNRMPNDHDWFEFARFGLHLPEQILSGIDTSRQCNNFAKKYYKILAWMHRKLFSATFEMFSTP